LPVADPRLAVEPDQEQVRFPVALDAADLDIIIAARLEPPAAPGPWSRSEYSPTWCVWSPLSNAAT